MLWMPRLGIRAAGGHAMKARVRRLWVCDNCQVAMKRLPRMAYGNHRCTYCFGVGRLHLGSWKATR